MSRRFWEKVRVAGPDECWEWVRARSPKGYGKFGYRGRNAFAHRVAWIFTNGEIPPGLCVLHRCDNPPCVNPSHLFLGTNKDNVRDRVAKGRDASVAGENNPRSRITDDDVRFIRTAYATGRKKKAEIARELGVGPWVVWGVLSHRNWSHVA